MNSVSAIGSASFVDGGGRGVVDGVIGDGWSPLSRSSSDGGFGGGLGLCSCWWIVPFGSGV